MSRPASMFVGPTRGQRHRGFQGPAAAFCRIALRRAEEAGWRIHVTGKNHVCLLPPRGRPVYLPVTSSSVRTARYLRAQLRRAGLRID